MRNGWTVWRVGKTSRSPIPSLLRARPVIQGVVANGYALFILASCGPDFSSPLAAGGEGVGAVPSLNVPTRLPRGHTPSAPASALVLVFSAGGDGGRNRLSG